jgi:hypothetical protein
MANYQTANDAIEDFGCRLGWTPETMLVVVCNYIDNQQDLDAFVDFLTHTEKEETESNLFDE